MKRSAALGGILWAVLLAASQRGLVHFTTIELMFLLAPLVEVPLGLELCARML